VRDLASGYWQVELDQSTVIIIKQPSAHHIVPFGLCSAPATFQHLMDLMLTGLQWFFSCLVNLNDVIVQGKDFGYHLQNVNFVFQCIRNASLKF